MLGWLSCSQIAHSEAAGHTQAQQEHTGFESWHEVGVVELHAQAHRQPANRSSRSHASIAGTHWLRSSRNIGVVEPQASRQTAHKAAVEKEAAGITCHVTEK